MENNYDFDKAIEKLWSKLGAWKIMALASCVDNYPMVRNVSCLFYNQRIYFKTDKNFRKTRQLYQNPRVAMCTGGIQVEGTVHFKGLVVDEPERTFETLYKKYMWQSYNAHSHVDSEILIEVEPEFVEIWDEDDDHYAFQIFIDLKKHEAEYRAYD